MLPDFVKTYTPSHSATLGLFLGVLVLSGWLFIRLLKYKSESKLASAKFKSQFAIVTGLLNEFDFPILTLDKDYLISYANKIFRKKFNCTGRDIDGLHICAFLDRELYSKITDMIESASKTPSHKVEKSVFSKLGDHTLISFNLSLEVKDIGGEPAYILFFREAEKEKKEEVSEKDEFLIQKYLSELEYSRLQLKKQSDELVEARDKALQATNAKSSFLANMSHEIRTPMNGLLGVTNLMRETELSEEQTGYLGIIQNCTESLLTLINDILDFSKIEAGKLTLSPICTETQKILSNCVALYKFPIDAKRIKLELNVTPEVPKYIVADYTRIQQILNNLLSNAIKFTPENGEIKISVKVEREGDKKVNLRFGIADNGIGITKEAQKRIFSAFEQADSSTTRKYGGTGLGLSICNALVKLMNGNIWAEGEVGEGTTFQFIVELDLPTADEVAQYEQEVTQAQQKLLEKSRTAKKELSILIAEDNIINQKIITKIVERMGHKVQTAMNGKEVLEALKHHKFNVILMDGQMPVMDGYEATRIIRQNEASTNEHIPVIAVTANAMKGDELKCREAGMDDYISKPIDRDKLEALLLKYTY